MKIAYPFCHNGIGGAEIYALNLAKMAKKNGHEVILILSKEGELSNWLKRENIRFEIIPMESSFNVQVVWKSIKALKNFYNSESIDIVHAQMLREHSLAIGAKFLGAKIKVIRTFHRLDQFDYKMVPLLPFYNWQTDGIIAISEYLQKYLNKIGFRRKVRVIYNGVPAVIATTHEKAIGFEGRITKEKGILQFVKENKDTFKEDKFIIGGDGNDREELEKLIKTEKPKNVEFVGPVTDLPDFFKKISVYVLPSETEVMPLAALEAFSAGVPVVAFSLPSLEGIITNENSVLVSGDYKDLAAKAIKLLHDSNNMNKKSNAARRDYKEKFTIDAMWAKTEALYDKVCVK